MEKQAAKIGSIFDTGWKIISAVIVIVSGIASVVFAWIQIETNTQDIAELNKELSREVTLMEERNEKRFNRQAEWNKERRAEFIDLEKRVRQLEIELSFEKGKVKK